MFGKLMKYDLRCCFRRFGALWIAILALGLLNGILMHGVFGSLAERGGLLGGLISGLPPVALFAVLVATAVLAFIFVCERFYNGLLGDEGYLMFTLPASVNEHIGAKTLTSLILWVISFFVAIGSGILFLLVYQPGELLYALRRLPEALSQIKLPVSVPLLMIEILVLLLVGVVKEILKIYAAISVGHLLGGRSKLIAILSYLAISVLENVLATFGIGGAHSMGLFSMLEEGNIGVQYVDDVWMIEGLGPVAGIIGVTILCTAVLCVVYFLISRIILSRNLNLE